MGAGQQEVMLCKHSTRLYDAYKTVSKTEPLVVQSCLTDLVRSDSVVLLAQGFF
jgi:hypothetical protein